MYDTRLRENLPRVEERIGRALARAGRTGRVLVIAVTKGHDADAVRAAARAGLTECGENRVQELEVKRRELGSIVRWHLIGHLQRNKVRKALPLFERIHSVDSPRLARELSAEAVRAGIEVRALVQVNASGEESKGGFDAEEGPDSIVEAASLPGLRVDGLMTMAPLTDAEVVLRRTFARTRALLEQCRSAAPALPWAELSMGMSNDYEIAVEEGSTMVRLGTVLFGERSP